MQHVTLGDVVSGKQMLIFSVAQNFYKMIAFYEKTLQRKAYGL